MDALIAIGIAAWICWRIRRWWLHSAIKRFVGRMRGATAPASGFTTLNVRGADRVTFDWNGETIDFSRFSALGRYDYTTRDGRFAFVFDLRQVGREIRICIIVQPPYPRGRATDGHSTHRYGIEQGTPWVCVKDSDIPTNVPDALSWLVAWSEGTAEYIRTGHRFS